MRRIGSIADAGPSTSPTQETRSTGRRGLQLAVAAGTAGASVIGGDQPSLLELRISEGWRRARGRGGEAGPKRGKSRAVSRIKT